MVKTLAQYAPNLPALIEDGQIITPKDLEETYGLTGGHIFHGELALDQFFTMRPLLDWARYRTPIQNLYLCGSGTHPGAGLDRRLRRQRSPRDIERVEEVSGCRSDSEALSCQAGLAIQRYPEPENLRSGTAGLPRFTPIPLHCDFGATPPGKRLCGKPTLGFTNPNLCSQHSAGQISGSDNVW